MESEKEKIRIRGFVKAQLREEPDLSTLTLGMLKKRYLAQTGGESLSFEARKFMKQVVEEELMKMQKNYDSESEHETKIQKKRKREKDKEGLDSEDETESTAKKSRSRQSGSASDSESKQTNSETGSQRKEQIGSRSANKDSDQEIPKKAKHHVESDDSSDDEKNELETDGNESPSPKEKVKERVNTSNGEPRGKNKPGSKEESESDADNKSEKSEKINDEDSSASEKEENVRNGNDSNSDSSSLPSLEEERKDSPDKTKDDKNKNKRKKIDEKKQGPKDEDKAVVRLKRYITLCGVRKNYKKLLDGCRSTRSKVAILKKELGDLGVRGTPSIEKCKKIRLKREEAQELAELNVNNIITTEGRPKRRGTSAMQAHKDPPSYQRTLNSDSDSDQENDARIGCKKVSEWANLRGIISDDADSD